MKSSRSEKIDERERSLKVIMKWERSSSELKAKYDRNENI